MGVRRATGAIGPHLGNRLLRNCGRFPRTGVLVFRPEPIFLGLGGEFPGSGLLRVRSPIGHDLDSQGVPKPG